MLRGFFHAAALITAVATSIAPRVGMRMKDRLRGSVGRAWVDITYHLIGNMLRVIEGKRYSMLPFVDKNGNRLEYPTQKIEKIYSWATALGMDDTARLFNYFAGPLRNAFSHSNYVLHEARFNIVRGKGMKIQNVITNAVPIETEVLPRINAALGFFSAFGTVWASSIAEYTENKIVRGRLQSDDYLIDIELTTEAGYGLTGFRSPPAPA
jgi:hypothetical protein